MEREINREQRMREFVLNAAAADRAVDKGAAIYSAGDVHDWPAMTGHSDPGPGVGSFSGKPAASLIPSDCP